MNTIKFLSSGSPILKIDGESFQVKPGFNEMPVKFTKDPYYSLCQGGGIIKDFESAPTDKQHEDFDKQIQEERERADALQKELDELKAASAAQQQSAPTDKQQKDTAKNKE